jgi:hypothetical protein
MPGSSGLTLRSGLTELEWAFLNDVIGPGDDPAAFGGTPEELLDLETDAVSDTGIGIAEKLWRSHGSAVVHEWAKDNPGTRPQLWWDFDAPRVPASALRLNEIGMKLAGGRTFPEPRRWICGSGTPAYEWGLCLPTFRYGLAVRWITEEEKAHYASRRSRGLGPSYIGGPIYPDYPPVYESQAAYLDRHGLPLPGERLRLKPKDFEPEVILVAPSRSRRRSRVRGRWEPPPYHNGA